MTCQVTLAKGISSMNVCRLLRFAHFYIFSILHEHCFAFLLAHLSQVAAEELVALDPLLLAQLKQHCAKLVGPHPPRGRLLRLLRDSERERERERDRQTVRQTRRDRQTDRHADNQRQREHGQTGRQSEQ